MTVPNHNCTPRMIIPSTSTAATWGNAGGTPILMVKPSFLQRMKQTLKGCLAPRIVAPYVKDGINDAVVNGNLEGGNPENRGTKAAAHFKAVLPPGGTFTVQVRFTDQQKVDPFADFEAVFEKRIQEADEFYAALQNPHLTVDEQRVQRQAFAGLLWGKQFYHYSVELWLEGDPSGPLPPEVANKGAMLIGSICTTWT